jgi:hypothetical protein
MMFPVNTGQHWSLLVLKTATLELYSIDSGFGKIFAHSDLQYAPFISTLEQVLKLNNRAITRSRLSAYLALSNRTASTAGTTW